MIPLEHASNGDTNNEVEEFSTDQTSNYYSTIALTRSWLWSVLIATPFAAFHTTHLLIVEIPTMAADNNPISKSMHSPVFELFRFSLQRTCALLLIPFMMPEIKDGVKRIMEVGRAL